MMSYPDQMDACPTCGGWLHPGPEQQSMASAPPAETVYGHEGGATSDALAASPSPPPEADTAATRVAQTPAATPAPAADQVYSDPGVGEDPAAYAEALLEQARPGEALYFLQIALQMLAPDEWRSLRASELLVSCGTCYQLLRQAHGALSCFSQAVTADATNMRAWSYLAGVLIDLGEEEEALRALNEGLEIDPNTNALWHQKGQLLRALGRVSEAIGCYDRILALNPKDVDAWVKRGRFLIVTNRFEDAIGCFDRAAALQPALAETLLPWKKVCESALSHMATPARDETSYRSVMTEDEAAVAPPAPAVTTPAPAVEKKAVEKTIAPPATVVERPAAAPPPRPVEVPAPPPEPAPSAPAIPETQAQELAARAATLAAEGNAEDAVECLDKATTLLPGRADFWYDKGMLEMQLSRTLDALTSLGEFVSLCGTDSTDERVPEAQALVEWLSASIMSNGNENDDDYASDENYSEATR